VTIQVEQRSESAGLVPLRSPEHLWAAYQNAVRDWEKAAAVEQAHYEVHRFASDAWHQKRAEEEATWRRSREAYDAWRLAIDSRGAGGR
jgi:predicted nucleic acid-binding protein